MTRLFVTGVTPVTMDDVTSGFNIATNISMDPTFAALTGFTQGDIREMLAYYRANAGFAFDEEAVYETMCRWYDNYRFSPDTDAEGKEPPREVALDTDHRRADEERRDQEVERQSGACSFHAKSQGQNVRDKFFR